VSIIQGLKNESSLEWKKIEVKYTNRCVNCREYISAGEIAFWRQGLGIKHIDCPTEIKEDNSALVIIDKRDKQLLGIK